MYSTDNLMLAFGLTLMAGLSTGVGSVLAFCAVTTNKKFLALSLGFSAGVMIYIAMIELFADARHSLTLAYGPSLGYWWTIISFFGGMALIALIDQMIPKKYGNPHEFRATDHIPATDHRPSRSLHRTGLLVAIAITIHNFPEGISTLLVTLENPKLGIAIAVAIALHNIPEGIAVSVPIYYATNQRRKAFFYSLLSGLAEPLGAIIGYFVLRPYITQASVGMTLAGVAGVMVFISFDELLPSAQENQEYHLSVHGLILGMGIMAITLLLLM